MSWLKENKERFFILLIVICSIPTIIPLVRSGFFLSDDGEWMVIRFSAFHQVFTDGQFPVRFLSRLNQEYGYPVANFLYPAFMYLAEIPKILGFGFVDSVKIILGVSMIASAIFIYLWLRKLFDYLPAFVGSLLYLYAPYHLYDLYKRGSVGEILALAVVPYILWQVERQSLFFTAIGISLLILSHNTLAVLFLPMIIGYMLLRKLSTINYPAKGEARQWRQLSTIVLGLGLSSFFWVPAIYDLQYTSFFQTSVANPQHHFADLNLVGSATIMVFALSFVVLFARGGLRRIGIFILVLGVIAGLLSLPISSSIWNILPVAFVQFPFRFLSLSMLSASFLSAFIIFQMKGTSKVISAVTFLILLTSSTATLIRPQAVFDKGDDFYATNMDSTTVKNEYMPKWVKNLPTERFKEPVELVSGRGKITDVFLGGKEIRFSVFMDLMEGYGVVRLNKVYFPGWRAFIDGNEVPISYENDKGVMDVQVPKGNRLVKFTFTETPVRFASDLVSIISLLSLIVISRRKLE